MAEDGMSIVPYGSNLDVVLRHNDSVVCLDRDSQELVLQNTAQSNGDLELADVDCPYCHRPMRDDHAGQDNDRRGSNAQPEFVNPNYFRMLHNSLPSSTDSTDSTPQRRRLFQPALPYVPNNEPNRSMGDSSSPQGISSGSFTQGYFKKFFVEESVLGKGGKGVVLLVRHVLDGVSLGYFACKRVPVGDDHEWLEKVLGEVQLLQHLSHQNLVSYRHVWLEDAKISTFGPSVPCAFILQQYCNAGDLHNYICGSVQTSTTAQQLKERLRRKSKGEPEIAGPRILQFDEIYSFFKDITSGLRYLHANGYIHRDLKPNNCLLSQTSDGIRVLVSDFGEVQSQDAIRRSSGTTGTVSYCAPEVLRREYPDGPFGNFTYKSDIFSLGMILYFLCFAELPYRNADIIHEEEDLDQLREEISGWTGYDNRRMIRPDLPEKLYVYLERLLSVDPNRRPSADEVLNGVQAGANANEHLRYRRGSPGVSEAAEIPFPRTPRSPKKSFPRSPAAVRPNGSHHFSTSAVEDVKPGLERRTQLSPERDVILRPRYHSPGPAIPPTPPSPAWNNVRHEEPKIREAAPQPQLLPAPPPSRFFLVRVTSLLQNPSRLLPLPFLQLCLFLLKMVTAFQPCMPLAVNPWVFYPLLVLAAVAMRTRNFLLQVITLALHLSVVGLSSRLGALCAWHNPSEIMFR